MKKYELVCILDPQLGESQFEEQIEKYENLLKANGAEVVQIDRWGLRKLAYTSVNLKRRQQGYYVLYQFEGEPAVMDVLEEDLKLDEGVLRHLFIAIKGEFLRVPQLAPDTVLQPPDDRRYQGNRGRPARPPASSPRSEDEAAPPADASPEKEAAAVAVEEGDAESSEA